eukprot:6178074-Pleurochrysis_carterae.AAC.1
MSTRVPRQGTQAATPDLTCLAARPLKRCSSENEIIGHRTSKSENSLMGFSSERASRSLFITTSRETWNHHLLENSLLGAARGDGRRCDDGLR